MLFFHFVFGRGCTDSIFPIPTLEERFALGEGWALSFRSVPAFASDGGSTCEWNVPNRLRNHRNSVLAFVFLFTLGSIFDLVVFPTRPPAALLAASVSRSAFTPNEILSTRARYTR